MWKSRAFPRARSHNYSCGPIFQDLRQVGVDQPYGYQWAAWWVPRGPAGLGSMYHQIIPEVVRELAKGWESPYLSNGQRGWPTRVGDRVVECVVDFIRRFGRLPSEVGLPPKDFSRWRREFGPYMQVALLPDPMCAWEEVPALPDETPVQVVTLRVWRLPTGDHGVNVG